MLRWLRLDQNMFQEKTEMINVALLLLCQKQTLEWYCLFNWFTPEKLHAHFHHIEFPSGFCLSYNPKHWSKECETINLLESVVDPYFSQVREELGLQTDQKVLILEDVFRAYSTDKVTKDLECLNIVPVMVPKNITHLLQLLDLTTNASVKKMEKKCFSEYITNAITKEMLRDPKRDVTTIEVDLRISTLKSEHAKAMRKVYKFLQSGKGCDVIKASWRAAGITDILK